MTDSHEANLSWQGPPELLRGIFEFFLTLEDGEPLLRVSSHVCSSWRHAALAVRLSDTGTSRPAGWRHMPLPEIGTAAPSREIDSQGLNTRHRPSPQILDDNDETEASIQAAIMKVTQETSVSVGCGEARVSIEDLEREGEDNKRRRRKSKLNRARRKRKPGEIDDNDNSTIQDGGDCIDMTLDVGTDCSGGHSGDNRKQKLEASSGFDARKRQRVSNRGLKKSLSNREDGVPGHNDANKEVIKTENGVGVGGRQNVELGWASRIWGAVQRFARGM